jgi:hypothetical protein
MARPKMLAFRRLVMEPPVDAIGVPSGIERADDSGMMV